MTPFPAFGVEYKATSRPYFDYNEDYVVDFAGLVQGVDRRNRLNDGTPSNSPSKPRLSPLLIPHNIMILSNSIIIFYGVYCYNNC